MIPIPPRPSDLDLSGLPAGTAVGSFVLQAVQSRSEFSIRYRATASASIGEVVIEEFAPAAIAQRAATGELGPRTPADAALWEEGLQAILLESEVLAKPLHPALVRIACVWQLRGTVYRLWPPLEGRTLAEVCAAWRQPPTESWLHGFFAPLLDAVESLHRAGWVHGNVRPGQILVRSDGGPLLLDPDAVRTAIGARMPQASPWPEPDFRPPELAEPPSGHSPGPWSDVYALAAVARFCMRAPRATDDFSQPAAAAAIARPSEALVAALERALAPDPRQRPQSIALFGQELRAAGASRPTPLAQDGHALSDSPLRARAREEPEAPGSTRTPAGLGPVRGRSGIRLEPVFRGEPNVHMSMPAPSGRNRLLAIAAVLAAFVIAAGLAYQFIHEQPPRPVGTSSSASGARALPERDAAASAVVATPAPELPAAPSRPPELPSTAPLAEPVDAKPEPPAPPRVAAQEPVRPASAVAQPRPVVPPREAPRRSAPALADTPAAACAPRTNFALYRCMQVQCERDRFYAHPQCVRLRRSDELPR